MTEFDNGLKANMFSNIDSKSVLVSRIRVKWGASSRWSSCLYCRKRKSDEMTIEKTHPTLFHLPIVTMNLKRIVSVGIGLNIFVNRMVLDHHRTSHQLSDFQFLSLTNIQPFWIDTLNIFNLYLASRNRPRIPGL